MKRFLFFGFILFLMSCSRSSSDHDVDCSMVDCAPVNGVFYVKIVDAINGQNKIANGSFDTTGIKVTNGAGGQLYVINSNNIGIDSLKNTVSFQDFSKSGTNSIKIVGKTQTINFTYDYTYKSSGCCGIGDTKNINVTTYPFSYYPVLGYNAANFKIIAISL
ncbi:MAG TPA: hypothetical protein PKE30_03960 [Niabella sp.]|nr:hypothetical protein [Niabella sp.]